MEHSPTGKHAVARPQPEPAARPEPRHRFRGRLWIAIAAIVLVVAAVTVGALSAVGPLGANRNANYAIDQARTDGDRIAAYLAVPDLFAGAAGDNPDFAKAKQDADNYLAKLDSSSKSLDADLANLRSADSQLKQEAQAVLTVPFHGQMNSQRTRVEGVISAFVSAQQLFAVTRVQIQGTSALFDAVIAFNALEPYLTRQDAAGALALYPALEQKLTAAAQATQGPNVPPQLRQVVGALTTLATDMKALLTAMQAQDFDALQAAASRMEANGSALSSQLSSADVEQAVATFEQTLLKPYVDRYNAGMKAAGITVEVPAPVATTVGRAA